MESNGLKMTVKNHTIILFMESYFCGNHWIISRSKYFINSWLERVTGVAPPYVHPEPMCQPKWLVTYVHLVK